MSWYISTKLDAAVCSRILLITTGSVQNICQTGWTVVRPDKDQILLMRPAYTYAPSHPCRIITIATEAVLLKTPYCQ